MNCCFAHKFVWSKSKAVILLFLFDLQVGDFVPEESNHGEKDANGQATDILLQVHQFFRNGAFVLVVHFPCLIPTSDAAEHGVGASGAGDEEVRHFRQTMSASLVSLLRLNALYVRLLNADNVAHFQVTIGY